MSFGRWYRLYKHYQNNHDLTVKGITYEQLRAERDGSVGKKNGEWF